VRAQELVAVPRRKLRRLASRVHRRAATVAVGAAPGHPVTRRLLPADVRPLVAPSSRQAPALELTTFRGRFVVGSPQADVTAWRLSARTSDAVTAVLTAAGVEHFATHLPYTRAAQWGARRDQLSTVVAALARELGPQGFYYQLADHAPVRLVREGLTDEELEQIRTVTVFQYVRCTTTGKLHGPPDGARIAVWDTAEARETLTAPGGMVQEVDRRTPPVLTTRTRWDGTAEPVLPGTDGDAAAIEFPVDAVYLWVDDSDPAWRARRDAARARLGLAEAPGAHHFRDRGELRASMRSLEMYAPWIRRIYLVTDDQRPHWLDTEHGRVRVVDHTEIFADPAVLPTFNSHAIGSQVHRIPDLADRYLLMNDDVMFAAPASPYDFFTPTGELKVFFSRSRRPDLPRDQLTTLELARANSAELLQRDYRRRASRLFAHVPVPQRKDVAIEVAERYERESTTTLRNPFRAPDDVVINSWLHLYTALFTGRAVQGSLRYGYFNIGLGEVRERLERGDYSSAMRVMCLNDVPPPGGREEDGAWLGQWLSARFPVVAPFERRSGSR